MMHHTKTSALIRLIAGGAPTPEEQAAAEEELDLRVPMPEIKAVVEIRAKIREGADAAALAHHASVIERYGVEIDLDSEGARVTCDAHSYAGVVAYLRQSGLFEEVKHDVREERA